MTLVGVTGGMAAGKSTALACFQELGASTVDADDVVHRLYAPDQEVYRAVVERWGRGILAPDGTVQRPAVAQRVFGNGAELQWLNALLHPLVQRHILELAATRADGLLCCGVPLLFETGWGHMVSRSVAVWCDPQTQWRRLQGRGWNEADIRARLGRQMSMDEKLVRADYGVINTGSLEMLRQQCRIVFETLTS